MKAIGHTLWAIPGGCIPLASTGREPDRSSRDELQILNASSREAHLEITIYYSDRAPVGPYRLRVDSQRVRSVRFNDLIDPEALPLGEPYASVIRSDEPILVQFTRVDTSNAANAITTTLAFAIE